MSRPLRSSKGWPVIFDDIGDDIGILETNDPFLISELEATMASQKGGVREVVTDEEWEVTKKKASEREQWRLRAKSFSEKPVRLEMKARVASPATASALPPDPSLSPPLPVGKPLEIPTELPKAPKLSRRPKPVTGDGSPKLIEAEKLVEQL